VRHGPQAINTTAAPFIHARQNDFGAVAVNVTSLYWFPSKRLNSLFLFSELPRRALSQVTVHYL
jgi:hypothetical protein